jgi:hypothetical protein
MHSLLNFEGTIKTPSAMKKTAIPILLTLFSGLYSLAQNVGIGTTTPKEALDIIGNINITGTIKVNETDGTANQVLMKNSAGTLVWGDMREFKNFETFTTNGNWTVPAGVSKIMLEAWGAGGGGSGYGAGGGGGYICAVFTVTPGQTINRTIGAAGFGSFTNSGSAGGATSFTVASLVYSALGGGGSTHNVGTNTTTIAASGGFSAPAGSVNFFGIYGETGGLSNVQFLQAGASLFYQQLAGGAGGNAGNANNTGGAGGYLMLDMAGPTILRAAFSVAGKLPGGGGGGGTRPLNVNTDYPGNGGGGGMVIIRY